MQPDTSQFHDVFFEEAAERLQELEDNVLRLESDSSNPVIDAVFRAAHSLKGASGTFGFDDIAAFTHILENVLERVRAGKTCVTPNLVGVVLRSVDVLESLLATAKTGAAPIAEANDVMAMLATFLEHGAAPPSATAATSEIFLFDDTAKAAEQGKERADAKLSPDVSTLRVPATKLDQLVDLVGELVIAQSMLTEAMLRAGLDNFDQVREATSHVERNMRELQERVMDVRMVPISLVFTRFPRLVRDLAAVSGKKIELALQGEDTELDKILVERLADPLTHLVRNAIDHGIETPEARHASGKPEHGTIVMSAYSRGGAVFIEVRDDGRGLDHDKIWQRAVERGLASPTQALSKTDVEALIFAPGFSTADTVSTISGRGVGMDVVKRTVESLGGTIALISENGRGTTTRLRLPLTLAMLSGMSVAVGSQTYIVPILSIVESLRPRREQVKTLLGDAEVVMLRDETLPIIRLDRLFGQPASAADPCEGILVVVENEGQRIALQVDELLGEQQVVVKSLDTNFRRVDGIMGATVMGDGRVALIVDAPSIVRHHTRDDEITINTSLEA